MKTLLALVSLVAMSATAHAANTLEFDFRADSQSIDYNDAVTAPDYSRIYIKTGRFQYKGSLNDRISYVARLGFYKPSADYISGTSTANSRRDSVNPSVEYAYVTDKMSDMFALSIGRLNTEIGGFEGGTSGADLYMVSPNYGRNGALQLGGFNAGINEGGQRNLLYMTGVKGTLAFAETQNIYLLYTNNGLTEPTNGTANNQNRGMSGVAWKGSFLDKTVFGLLSYHEFSPQPATTVTVAAPGFPDAKQTFMSAGIKYDVPTWMGSLEYTVNEAKDGAAGEKDKLWSGVVKLAYKMDQWTPRLEYFMSEQKLVSTATDGTIKMNGVGAVLEYKPMAENFRYHIAYNMIDQKPITGDTLKRNELVVGARVLGDFLK